MQPGQFAIYRAGCGAGQPGDLAHVQMPLRMRQQQGKDRCLRRFSPTLSLGPHRNCALPCRARRGLQAAAAQRAQRMRCEFPASPRRFAPPSPADAGEGLLAPSPTAPADESEAERGESHAAMNAIETEKTGETSGDKTCRRYAAGNSDGAAGLDVAFMATNVAHSATSWPGSGTAALKPMQPPQSPAPGTHTSNFTPCASGSSRE